MNATWSSVFGAKALAFPFLSFAAELNGTNFTTTNTLGTCQFSSPTEVWKGTSAVSLHLEDFTQTDYRCELEPTTPQILLKFLAGLQNADAVLENLDFPLGLHLTYSSQEYLASGEMVFLGVPASFASNFSYLPDVLSFDLDPYDFTTARGNLVASNTTGSLKVTSRCEGRISGVFEMWGILQNTTMYIEDTMDLSISGRPFGGIYEAEIGLRSETSRFDEASWTAEFSISEADIVSISEGITSNLNTWVSVGLETLGVAAAATVSALARSAEAAADLCTEECAERPVCTSPLAFQCIEKAESYECVETVGACVVTTECLEEEEYCADSECTETVVVCLEYLEVCGEGEEVQCVALEAVEIGMECIQYGMDCEEEKVQDPECVAECLFLEMVYEEALEEYRVLEMANEEVQQEMAGFYDLEMALEWFKIYSVGTSVVIAESGVGPRDIVMTIELGYFSEGGISNKTLFLPWNYDSEVTNASMLTGNIIVLIVSAADNLTDQLLTKTPREVYYEKITIP